MLSNEIESSNIIESNDIIALINNKEWEKLQLLLVTYPKVDFTDEKAVEKITFNFYFFIKTACTKDSDIDKKVLIEIAELFLNIGAHPTKEVVYEEISYGNKYQRTTNCFETALSKNNADLVSLFLNPPCNVDVVDLLAQKADRIAQDFQQGRVALDAEMQAMLTKVANPIILAINYFAKDCLAIMIDSLGDNNPVVEQICSDGILKVMQTTRSVLGKDGRLGLIQTLIAKGGKPISIDSNTGESCLHEITSIFGYGSDFSYKINLCQQDGVLINEEIAKKLVSEHEEEFKALVKLLLDNGADLTKTTKEKPAFKDMADCYLATPITLAVTNKHWICVKEFANYLIQHPDKILQDRAQCGRALYALISSKEFNNMDHEKFKISPFEFADPLELVELLLKAGAKKSATDFRVIIPFKNENNINEHYLDVAIRNKNQALIKLLLKYEVGFSFTTIEKAFENGFFDVAEILITKNQIPCDNSIIFSSVEEGFKSLILAVQYGQWELASKLFDICKEYDLGGSKSEITQCLYFMLDKIKDTNFIVDAKDPHFAFMNLFQVFLEFSNPIQPLIVDKLAGQKTENCIQLAIRKKMSYLVKMLFDKAETYERPVSINEKIRIFLETLELSEKYNNENCIKLSVAKILEISGIDVNHKELVEILYKNAKPVGTYQEAERCAYLILNKLRNASQISITKELISLLMTAAEFNDSECVDFFIEKLWESFEGSFGFEERFTIIWGDSSAEKHRSLLGEQLSLLSKNALKLLIPKLADYPKVESAEFRKIITACLAKHCDDEEMCEFLLNYLKKPQVSIIPVTTAPLATSVYNTGLTYFNSTASTTMTTSESASPTAETVANSEYDQEKNLDEIDSKNFEI